MGIKITGSYTRQAIDTEILMKGDLWFKGNGLRIMTPLTVQLTTFQKNGCSNPWTVMEGTALDVKDDACFGH
jgi:hypothetical protein